VKHCYCSSNMRRTAALCLLTTAAAAKFEDKWEKFCGVPDCYTELGLFPNATKAQIRRAYRSLSLEFHPDKNPGDSRALRKFNRVARANEVLTDDEQRKKLDYYTENPSEYWSLYGTFVDFSYAPKTSLKGVLFILLVFAALVQPALQYSKYQEYTKALVKAALARAPEGAVFRKEADEIVAEESKKRKKGKKTKMTSQEEKAFLKETLQRLVAKSDLPDEYAFPSLRDNLFVKVATYPLSMFKSGARSSELKKKIASGQVLDADEAQEVIEGYLGGADAWDALSGTEQHKLLSTKCYLKENFDKWQATRPEVASPIKASTKREIRQRKKGAPAFVMDE